MAANDGFGVVLKRTISATPTTIAALRDVNGPNMTKSFVDVTTKDSTNRWREFLSTLRDGGEVNVNIVYDPSATTHLQVVTDFGADDTATWGVYFTDGTNYKATFLGFVTAFNPTGPIDGELSADITIKITGPVTIGT